MAVCPEFIQPLNFECILLNIFAESHTIFLFGSYLLIAIIAAYFRMSGFLLVSLIFLYTIIIATFVDVQAMLLIIWIAVAMGTYAGLAKVFKN